MMRVARFAVPCRAHYGRTKMGTWHLCFQPCRPPVSTARQRLMRYNPNPNNSKSARAVAEASRSPHCGYASLSLSILLSKVPDATKVLGHYSNLAPRKAGVRSTVLGCVMPSGCRAVDCSVDRSAAASSNVVVGRGCWSDHRVAVLPLRLPLAAGAGHLAL